MTPGNLYTASLVALSLLIALAVSWPAFLIVAALWLLIALALMWSERGELQRLAKEATQLAEDAVAEGEAIRRVAKSMADGMHEFVEWQHKAEKTIARLAAENVRLQNDALAAQMAASDADVIPLPVRDGGDLTAVDRS